MDSIQTKQAWYLSGSLITALLLLIFVLYQQTILYVLGFWNQLEDGEYAHGYLVLAISAYLIFKSRQKLVSFVPRAEYSALLVVVAAAMLWLVAALVDVHMLQVVGLLLLILGLVWTVLGNQVIRVLVFPILFISFAIPIWFPISPLLQDLTADVVFEAIRMLGVPALRHENIFTLPAGKVSVEEACSGLRYLLAALTLGSLYAYMYYSSVRARLIVVMVAAISALVVNMLRVLIVVYLAYSTEMQHPLVDDHLALGWYLFGGMVVILLFVEAYLYKRLPLVEADDSKKGAEVVREGNQGGLLNGVKIVVVCGLLVSAGPVIVYKVSHLALDEASIATFKLPPEIDGWSRSVEADDDWNPVYRGAVNLKQLYVKDKDVAIVYMGYYPAQKQGEELIYSFNRISNEDIWRPVYPKARSHHMVDQQMLEQLLHKGADTQRLVWYWYNMAGMVTTNKYEAKALQVLGLLTGKPWAFVVAVAVQTDGDVEHSRQILKDFITLVEKPLNKEIERIAERQ